MANPVTLDRYQLLGELGQGSFGIVYLAYDPKLEREVAVKLVKPEIAQDPEVKLRFRREWKAIGRLRHPNIIELLDYSDGEWMYLVTERLAGKTLLQLVQEQLEPFSVAVAAAIVHEVALALENAHEQGIVHRDVKPENIFLEPNGRIVLCDFGIAFASQGDADTTMRGRNTQLLGSPLYMSPEQVASEGVGPKSDLFSLGAVAYFLATGKEAFLEASVLGVLKRIQAGQYHPFPGVLQQTPYAKAVDKLLQADMTTRFEDAGQVADAFLDVLKEAGQGDPRRVLKQSLASFAHMQTATASRKPKPLEELDGDSKTYIHKLASTNGSTPTSVVAGLSQTSISTGAMQQTSGGAKGGGISIAIIAAVVLSIAGVAGAYQIITSKPPPKVIPVHVDVQPPLPQPPLGNQGLPTPTEIPKPHPLPPDDPPGAPTKDPIKHVVERKDPPAVKAKGTLRVIVVPWGEVFVDGVRMGVTPEVRDLTLTEGPHKVRIVNKDFVAQERTVTVQPNDTVKVRVELQ